MAAIGSINKIYNPQLDWQSFTNTTNAVPGAPVESDVELRMKQTVSTSLPSQGIIGGIYGAIGNVLGVTRWMVYENDTANADINGIPANSISCVVEGGSTQDIVNAIGARKPPGIKTYGSVAGTFYDPIGISTVINFFPLSSVSIYFSITIKALPGYIATTGTLLIKSLSDFINTLQIGEDMLMAHAQASASLIQSPIGQTYYITSLYLGLTANPVSSANIIILFNQAAICSIGNIVLTVT